MATMVPVQANAPAFQEERTWRCQIESPKGAQPLVQWFRETNQLDANQAVLAGTNNKDLQAYSFLCTPENMAALPPQFVLLLQLLPDFFDWATAAAKAAEVRTLEAPYADVPEKTLGT